jgi:hypothetical protein
MSLTTLPMISMEEAAARSAIREYRQAVREQHRAEDLAILRGYRQLVKGRKLLDLEDVMRQTGLDERGRPRLAICRADAQWCYFRHHYRLPTFSFTESLVERATLSYIRLPRGTYGADPLMKGADGRQVWQVRALLPSIPPRLRPKAALSHYHILWEAEWEAVPRDPLLLRHLHGQLYAVLAHWDLTDLERAILKGRLQP